MTESSTRAVGLRSGRGVYARPTVRFTATKADEDRMARLKKFYSSHMGRPVSSTIVVRRALEVLHERVAKLPTADAQRGEALRLPRLQ